MQTPSEGDNIKRGPSRIWLLWFNLTQILIWLAQWQWPSIANQASNHYNSYCRNTYYDGFNDPTCSDHLINKCHSDKSCGLYYLWDGWDTSTYWSSSDNGYYSWFMCDPSYNTDSCSNCECIEINLYNGCKISLYVFLSLGLFFEFIRLILTLFLLASTHNIDNKIIISMVGDGIQFRILKIIAPSKYKLHLNIDYKPGYFYKFINPWFFINFVLHEIPCGICAILLLSFGVTEANINWYQHPIITMIIPLIIYLFNIILKIRLTDGRPWISSKRIKLQAQARLVIAVPHGQHGGPQFAAPTALVQQQQSINNIKYALVQNTFIAKSGDQLSVNQGENVKIIGDKNKFGWILAENGFGKKGFVPYAYLQIFNVNNNISISAAPAQNNNNKNVSALNEGEGGNIIKQQQYIISSNQNQIAPLISNVNNYSSYNQNQQQQQSQKKYVSDYFNGFFLFK